MKKVSFECNDESLSLFVNLINKLVDVSSRRSDCKIRVGGDEFAFLGGIDGIDNFKIDDRCFASLISQELTDIHDCRVSAIHARRISAIQPPPVVQVSTPPTDGNAIPVPANIPVSTPPTTTSLNDDDIQDIKGVVNDLMSKNEMFTAYDVTKELRHSGKSVKHYEVKEIVHAMYNDNEMGTYRKGLASFGNPPPFVYHPDGVNPDTYSN